MTRRVSKDEIEECTKELRKHSGSWLRRPNVTAVDVGYKIRENEITDELAIRVHVERKKQIEELKDYEKFSTTGEDDRQGSFSVDVIEGNYGPSVMVGIEAAAVNRKSRVSPLIGGISVGHPKVSAGTLGAIVWDKTDCQVAILSNWHVLCGSTTCQVGDSIYQPGVFDGGTAADEVAKLKRFQLNNHMDAAIAGLTGRRPYVRDILEFNPIAGVESPRLGMKVVKSGRTTGLTEGIIDGVNMSLSLNYGGGTVQAFTDQIHIVPRPPWPNIDYEVSKGGDSGSVWINESNNKAVGLHFAGETTASPADEHAIANRMEKVVEEMNISFLPIFCKPTVIDPRLHDILRRILCARYPWLCGQFPFTSVGAQSPFTLTSPGSEALPASSPVQTAGNMMMPNIDDVIEEILNELAHS